MVFYSMTLLAPPPAHAQVIDRVVAFVDDEAVTLSELEETFEATKRLNSGITRREVLDTMINRVLLLKGARKLKIAARDDEAIREYVNLKAGGFLKPGEEEIRQYYDENVSRMGLTGFEEQKAEIEELLREKRLNEKLKRHVKELRRKAYIKIIEEIP